MLYVHLTILKCLMALSLAIIRKCVLNLLIYVLGFCFHSFFFFAFGKKVQLY